MNDLFAHLPFMFMYRRPNPSMLMQELILRMATGAAVARAYFEALDEKQQEALGEELDMVLATNKQQRLILKEIQDRFVPDYRYIGNEYVYMEKGGTLVGMNILQFLDVADEESIEKVFSHISANQHTLTIDTENNTITCDQCDFQVAIQEV